MKLTAKAVKLAAALVACGLGAFAFADDPVTVEALQARIQALDVKGAEDMLAKLKGQSKAPEAREALKSVEKEIEHAKKLVSVSKKMEKLFEEKKFKECYAAYVAAADALPRALALDGLRDNAREARRQAYFVVDDFDGEDKKAAEASKPQASPAGDTPKPAETPKPQETPKGDDPPADPPMNPGDDPAHPGAPPVSPPRASPSPAPAPSPAEPAPAASPMPSGSPAAPQMPKKSGVQWTPHACSIQRVPDPMRGMAMRFTVEPKKKRAFADGKLEKPIDLSDYDQVSIRVRTSAAPRGTLSIGFSQGKNEFVEGVIAVEPDGKWHDLKWPVSELKQSKGPGGLDLSAISHAVIHYAGNDAVDIEVDDFLLSRNTTKKP